MLTEDQVREAVADIVKEAESEFDDDDNTDRDTVLEWLDEQNDSLWGNLVKQGRLDQYDLDDLLDTVQESATIIKVAQEDAWIEDDSGLWEGLTYGVVPCIAFFSLRNLLYKALKDAGYDTDDEFPFKKEEEE